MNKETKDRMQGLTNEKALEVFAGAAKSIFIELINEGFDTEDIENWLNLIVKNQITEVLL